LQAGARLWVQVPVLEKERLTLSWHGGRFKDSLVYIVRLFPKTKRRRKRRRRRRRRKMKRRRRTSRRRRRIGRY
jgi:hypothetical protein